MKGIAEFKKVSERQYASDCAAAGKIALGYGDIILPKRATAGSAGYDFFAPCDIKIEPGETVVIPTGVRAAMEDGWVLMIFPRSGLGFKYRLQLDNTVGIIDSDYYFGDNEGHILVKISNLSAINGDGKSVFIPKGKGFCQGVFLRYGLTSGDDAENKRRGGFGSTSK